RCVPSVADQHGRSPAAIRLDAEGKAQADQNPRGRQAGPVDHLQAAARSGRSRICQALRPSAQANPKEPGEQGAQAAGIEAAGRGMCAHEFEVMTANRNLGLAARGWVASFVLCATPAAALDKLKLHDGKQPIGRLAEISPTELVIEVGKKRTSYPVNEVDT